MRNVQQKNRTAYTLLELVVALAVVTLFATIAIPSVYQSYLRFRTLDQSVDSAMNSILLSKRLAIQKSTPYVYEFMHGGNVQTIYQLSDTRLKKAVQLPNSVRLFGTDSKSNGMVQLVFREDGSTDGFEMKVECQSRTEGIQVLRHLGIPQRTFGK